MRAFGRRELFLGGGAALAGRSLWGQPKILAPGFKERQALIEDLVAANHILFMQGVVDAFGHVSVRTASGAARYLVARSIAPAQVTAADIIEYDLDSKPVDIMETRSGYRERFIHGEIYRTRPEVMSVVHCHTSSLIPFGITGVPLRPVFHNSSFVGEGVPVFEIRDSAGDTDMLISSIALAKPLAAALGNKPAILMRGHGAVVVGKTLIEAVARSVYLDVNARVQSQAMSMGREVTYLSPGEVRTRGASDEFTRAWELWKQQVSQEK